MPGEPMTMRRPPVRQATTVRRDVAHTFEVFVATIAQWWPLRPFSAGHERIRDVVFDQRESGRVYEVWEDGTTVDWGELLVWEPPRRFVMTWEMTPATTEVELRFTALGPSLTRVEVEHRGWEALTEDQAAADCALPGGGYADGSYNRGWTMILDRFTRAAES